MGNCQAVDAAALVIQHPSGKIERWYCPISVTEVMKMNPGHYVSLIIPLPIDDPQPQLVQDPDNNGSKQLQDKSAVQYTRVKLLRPTDTLVLGRAYRLVTTQEVMKVIQAKKYAKLKKKSTHQPVAESAEKPHVPVHRLGTKSEKLQINKAVKDEGDHQAKTMHKINPAAGGGRPRSWKPSLQSICEAGSS